jgi:hypothetical protein
MPTRRPAKNEPRTTDGVFPGDRRDRRPGTHFAAELGAPRREKLARRGAADDPHVDEDLGVSAFGIDLPFLKH